MKLMQTINSSISSGEIGNTKQISPSKHWCFTINNYDKADIDNIISISSSIVPKYIFQEEIGDEGTPHLQGYLSFNTKKRPFSVFKKTNIHWEKCRNISASIKYCSKEDTKAGERWIRGIKLPKPKYIKEIKHMYKYQKKIIKLISGEPDERTLNWFYENKGCSGKTTLQKYIYTHFENVLIVGGKASDMKHAVVSHIEKYDEFPKIILANIPRTSMNFISYAGIEEVKDMFFFSGKYEGGQVCGPCPHFIIFSNEEPDYEAVSSDRWNVVKIRVKKKVKSEDILKIIV